MFYRCNLDSIVFKRLFRGEECEEHLLSFLNSILGQTLNGPLLSAKILNERTISRLRFADELDPVNILASTSYFSAIFIEIDFYNSSNSHKFEVWQQASYLSDIMKNSHNPMYHRSYYINIINYPWHNPSCDDFHTVFMDTDGDTSFLKDVDGAIDLSFDKDLYSKITPVAEVHTIDVDKYHKIVDKDWENNLLHRWLSFLNTLTPDSVLQNILQISPDFMTIDNRFSDISLNKESLFFNFRNN